MSMTEARKDELHAQYATYVADSSIAYDVTQKNGSAHVGKAVMMTAEGTVGLATSGLEILGKLIKVEPDGFCNIQDEGYCEVPLDGAIVYAGATYGVVGGTTAGSVKAATVVPAAGAIRTARAIQSSGTAGKVIIKL